MSTDRGEPEPQEWPTYPGMPSDPGKSQPQPPAGDPASRPYAQPDPSYQPYQDYARARPDPGHVQPHQAPYQQSRGQGSDWLRNKWMWIVAGIIAVFVITGLARGDFPWVAVIFGLVVWNILRHKRRQG